MEPSVCVFVCLHTSKFNEQNWFCKEQQLLFARGACLVVIRTILDTFLMHNVCGSVRVYKYVCMCMFFFYMFSVYIQCVWSMSTQVNY